MRKEVEKLTESEDDDDVELNIITNNKIFTFNYVFGNNIWDKLTPSVTHDTKNNDQFVG